MFTLGYTDCMQQGSLASVLVECARSCLRLLCYLCCWGVFYSLLVSSSPFSSRPRLSRFLLRLAASVSHSGAVAYQPDRLPAQDSEQVRRSLSMQTPLVCFLLSLSPAVLRPSLFASAPHGFLLLVLASSFLALASSPSFPHSASFYLSSFFFVLVFLVAARVSLLQLSPILFLFVR